MENFSSYILRLLELTCDAVEKERGLLVKKDYKITIDDLYRIYKAGELFNLIHVMAKGEMPMKDVDAVSAKIEKLKKTKYLVESELLIMDKIIYGS